MVPITAALVSELGYFENMSNWNPSRNFFIINYTEKLKLVSYREFNMVFNLTRIFISTIF